jgi:hypothetical protein
MNFDCRFRSHPLNWLIAAGVLLSSASSAIAADDVEPPGPLRIRDMTPPAILTLGFMPASASLLAKGEWGLELHYSSANVFLMSDSVKTYLENRAEAVPLTQTDARTIFDEAKGDVFYFDGQISRFDIGAHYALTDDVQVFAQVPYFTFGGGNLDYTIMEFHDTFGFGQAGRDLVARNHYQVLMRLGDAEYMTLEAHKEGLGDPTVGVRHRVPFPGEHWSAAAEWAVKLPVADEERFLSNGHTDYGVQLIVQRLWKGSGLYLSGSYVWLGDFNFANFSPADVPSATLAYSHRLNTGFTWVLQGLVSRSIYAGKTSSELSSIEYQVSAGLRYRHGPALFSFALTENVANFQNTPDIGFHLSTCFIIR